MRNEDDFDVLVTPRDELEEQEEEAARQIFLGRVHGSRCIHDAQDHRVRFPVDLRGSMFVSQIVLVEGDALVGELRGHDFPPSLNGLGAPQLLADSATSIKSDSQADSPVSFSLALAKGLDRVHVLSFEVRQIEVLEHDVDQFVERNICLVVVDPGLLTGVAGLSTPGFGLLPDDITALDIIAGAFSDLVRVVTVDETVLLESANGDLDDSITGASDDRFFRDDVRDVVADR